MAERAKSRKARRREAREAARAEERRQQIQRRLIIGGIAVLLIGAIGWWVYGIATREQPGEFVASLGNQHIPAGDSFTGYNTTPPTSGPHYGNIAPWGIHDEPIPNELQVHNLEDGGVMVQYNCPDGCDELVADLTEIVEDYEDHVILAPYTGIDNRIALTAWRRIDLFDEFDAERVRAFIEAYRGIDNHAR